MWTKLFYVVLMMGISAASYAEQLYLKPGSSKQINTRENIKTVFISSPDIADYKVISKKSVVLYGKKNGMAEISVYNGSSKVIYNANLSVDPFLPDLSARIKQQYPKSDVSIKRYNDNNGKSSYLLTGMAESEEIKDSIYQMVGSVLPLQK